MLLKHGIIAEECPVCKFPVGINDSYTEELEGPIHTLCLRVSQVHSQAQKENKAFDTSKC